MSEGLLKERIKQAFWSEFHKSGERWFNYLGTEEENEESTGNAWRNGMGESVEKILDEVEKEFPTLLHETQGCMDMRVYTEKHTVDWEKTAWRLSQFIITCEVARKKWFGSAEPSKEGGAEAEKP